VFLGSKLNVTKSGQTTLYTSVNHPLIDQQEKNTSEREREKHTSGEMTY